MRAMVANGHSGHEADPSVAILTPAAKGLTSLFLGNRLDTLEKKQFFEYYEIVEGAQI